MDLNLLLKKTEMRSAKIKSSRQPLTVATKERPYFNDLDNNSNIVVAGTHDSKNSEKNRGIKLELELEAATKSVISDYKNDEQTVSKLVANDEQTIFLKDETVSKLVAKPEAELEANRKQTVSKLVANDEQTIFLKDETVSKLVAKPEAELEANRKQTVSKEGSNLRFAFLSGIQKLIVLYIYEDCSANRSKVSNEITVVEFAKISQSTDKTAKNAVMRLVKKQIIIRYDFKNGRGGWTRYELNHSVYQEIRDREIFIKLVANREQTVSKLVAKPEAKPEASSPCSSSLREGEPLKKTTTTAKSELADDWKEIDCAPLRDLKEPFGENHIRRLFKSGKTNPAQVQENINRIAYAIKHKTVTFKKSPIAMLMGLLSEGIDFDAPKGYYGPTIKIKEPVASTPSQESESQDSRSSDELATAAATEAKRQIAALTAHLKDMP